MKAFERTSRPSRTRKLGLAGAGAVVVTAGAASTAQADVILSPTAVVSNSMGEINPANDIGNVIDQSSLSSGFISGTTDYSSYLLAGPTHGFGKHTSWESPTTTGNIVFDLGSVYSIDRLAIWNSSEIAVNSITLETSLDTGFTTPLAAGSFNVPKGAVPTPVNDFDLTDSVGRYVRLTINSNHGAPHTGFREIAFEVSSAAVPEPSSLALLAAFGAALITRRFRKPV